MNVQPFEGFPFEGFPFEVTVPPRMQRLQPTPRARVGGRDFAATSYSGPGTVAAAGKTVDVRIPPGDTPSCNTGGCEGAN